MSAKETDLKPGLIGTAEIIVAARHTAAAMGSGIMPVLATPSMIVLMEMAAQVAVSAYLPEDYQSVGAYLEVRHYGATPIGMRVVAKAELTAIEGRNLVFRIAAHDDIELIGEGVHRRAMSSVASFNRLLQKKMKSAGIKTPNTKLE